MTTRPGAGCTRRAVVRAGLAGVLAGSAGAAVARGAILDASDHLRVAAMSSATPPAAEPEPPLPTLVLVHHVMPPGPSQRADALKAVEAVNQRQGRKQLPPELDIGHFDAAKVGAFIDGLPRLPAAQRQALAGTRLRLDAPGLGLGSSSAVTADALRQGYGLRTVPAAGGLTRPAVDLRPDRALALQRAEAAKQALAKIDGRIAQASEVARREPTGPNVVGLAELRQDGRSVAMVWRDVLASLPEPPAAALAEATAAFDRFGSIAPAQGGMP